MLYNFCFIVDLLIDFFAIIVGQYSGKPLLPLWKPSKTYSVWFWMIRCMPVYRILPSLWLTPRVTEVKPLCIIIYRRIKWKTWLCVVYVRLGSLEFVVSTTIPMDYQVPSVLCDTKGRTKLVSCKNSRHTAWVWLAGETNWLVWR